MKVLITGANGMVAKAVKARCVENDDEVFAMSRAELNISSDSRTNAVVTEIAPDVVINCAAYTDVDGAETNHDLNFGANHIGVKNLAEACRAIDCGFVTISTDFVFDGKKPDGFYTQRDTPRPLGEYGKAKRAGEIAAMTTNARSIIVRSGWIYGPGGTNFLSVMPELFRSGKSMTAISDSYGTPTYAVDLAGRLLELAKKDIPGIFHITNSGDGTSYFGFAQKMAEIGGFDADLVADVGHDQLKRPAQRPVNSRLACLYSEAFGLKPMRHWTDALEAFLTAKSV